MHLLEVGDSGSELALGPPFKRFREILLPHGAFSRGLAPWDKIRMSAGNGIFSCGDRATEIAVRHNIRPQRPKDQKPVAQIPAQTAYLNLAPGFGRTGWWAHQGTKGEILPGEQPPIMERALFDAVQQKLTAGSREGRVKP